MKKNVFILGAGSHTKVLLDCLCFKNEIAILGILETNSHLIGTQIFNIPVVGEEELNNHSISSFYLINGIGSIDLPIQRKNIFEKFKKSGYTFLTVQHSTAYAGFDVVMGEGVQLIAGSLIQPGTFIGNNVIINTRATVDHDCNIGDHVHLAPGVICCGNVKIGSGTHVGCGAVIRQGITIAENCVIGAGAVVIHDILSSTKVAGIPAKIME